MNTVAYHGYRSPSSAVIGKTTDHVCGKSMGFQNLHNNLFWKQLLPCVQNYSVDLVHELNLKNQWGSNSYGSNSFMFCNHISELLIECCPDDRFPTFVIGMFTIMLPEACPFNICLLFFFTNSWEEWPMMHVLQDVHPQHDNCINTTAYWSI